VQLFKSLICWHGYDCRKRFAIINVASYICFVLLVTIFASSAILSIFALVLTIFFSGASIKRRLNDTNLNNKWLILPSSLLALTGLALVFSHSTLTYWLVLLPLLLSAVLLTYPSKTQRKYILGYDGPINLNEHTQAHQQSKRNNRIEPTLMGEAKFSSTETLTSSNIEVEDESQVLQEKQLDIGEMIRLRLFNKKYLIIFSVAMTFLLVIAIIFSMISSGESENNTASNYSDKDGAEVRLHPISFPDNFHIMLSEHNGVIINWEGDNSINKEIWSLNSALGDKSCENIKFNNGDKRRALRVNVEDNSQYYASFSPLDTNDIIQGIAFRGTFTLCGYTFSLKGSQAILGKNMNYADMVEY
jgi:hypothetical protein